MKLYLAASSREADRVRRAQLAIRERGWLLTLDWLTELESNLARGVRDADLSREDQRRHAQADLDAIREADVVWLLAPQEPTKGAWTELGFALGIGKPVVVSGAASCIFLELAALRCDSDESAPGAIEGLLRWETLRRIECVDCHRVLAVTTLRDAFGAIRCNTCARDALLAVPG